MNINENILYSPAEGKVLEISEKNNNIKISIFLSIFDNHTQYIPIKSIKIDEYFNYGHFYFAQNIENSIYNQNLRHVLHTKFGNIQIIQYSGYFARRIYSLSDDYNRIYTVGDRLGYIRFGSRVDIIVPKKNIDRILIKKGMKIKPLIPMLYMKT